jgi:phage terminase large subunit-like protein
MSTVAAAAVAAAALRVPEFEGARFDADRAARCIAFFPTYLRLTKAEWAGKPFHLADWQAVEVARFFGWLRPDGTRVYRRMAVWVARKNGKTEFLAGISLLALIIDREYGGEGYCIARDKDQAKIVFGKMAEMVSLAPKAFADEFDTFKTAIVYTRLASSFKPLSGRADGKHGLSMSVLAGDEVHEWTDDQLYTFVHQSCAARRQPAEFLASTAGRKATYGHEFYEHCLDVAEGRVSDPELLVVIHAAGPDDDWSDEATWRKANPNLGVSPKLEYLRAEHAKAKRLPRLENDFRRYHLNQWVEQETRWLPMDDWRRCTAVPEDKTAWQSLAERCRGRRAYGGLDLASTNDITALVWVFPPDETCDRWIWLPRLWVPAAAIKYRPQKDRARFEQWAACGALIETPGNVTDYDFVESAVLQDAAQFEVVKGPAIDRWNATQVAIHLGEGGLPVEMFGQGFASMSAPMKEIERQVLSHAIEHGSHPVLDWMASNITVKADDAGNLKPSRSNRSLKIDGIVAGIMGTGLAIGDKADGEPVAPWENPDYRMAV